MVTKIKLIAQALVSLLLAVAPLKLFSVAKDTHQKKGGEVGAACFFKTTINTRRGATVAMALCC